MRVGSLFAGIGGFDLAARWMGWETAWFSEIDPYASAVLAKHWPGVPNHGDITKIDFRAVEPVDLLCGGFPCQDISKARKGQRSRQRVHGAKSGLWSEQARAIDDLRPRYAVVENSPELLTGGLERVLGDLASLGYDAEWEVLSATELGAPHIRERIYLLAYPSSIGDGLPPQAVRPRWPRPVHGTWWASEPGVCRVAHGVPARVDRLRCLGNAIVPQCALVIFQAIQAREAVIRAA